jgi:hypothetical protein
MTFLEAIKTKPDTALFNNQSYLLSYAADPFGSVFAQSVHRLRCSDLP